MKNTILKIAGVKNQEALYKKYATEADFLKANPKFALGGKMNIQAIQKFGFGGNEEIITPTTNSNRQTYPKTITYSPQEWHQKNILAGNVMLGKNNDLNTMFKNNIYPQYTLPNDTVPINYSPVVKQLPMPKGFVDNSKSTFNYTAGQQLLKQANGGQMNFQTMPQFATGGQIAKNIGAGLYGVGEGLLDTVTLGATDQITDMGYKALQKAGGSTEDEIREQDSIHGFSQAAGAIGGAVINPAGTGAAIGQTGKGLGEGISRGNESEEWARTTGQVLNAAGAIGSMAYGNFGSAGATGAAGAAGNASKLTGQSANFAGSNFGKFAQNAGKYGSMAGQTASILQPMFNQGHAMGGIQQYAMGGFGDPTDPPISTKIINNAQKVGTVPSNYNKIGSQDNKTYYDVASDKAKSNPLGNGTGPNPGWEQSIIKRLQSGTSAQSLSDAGHISSSQIEKYNQYYKPLYTETQPTNTTKINTQIPLADENKIDRKQVFSGSPYNTFQYPDSTGGYAKATTRYFDPKTNKEIDAFKSFDSEGNYAPLYLNNPSEGIQGTLKQTRINTPINSPVDSIPVNTGNSGFKYGGKMQYAMGGMNVQPNAEAENDELVTTNTPPQVVSGGEVNMVSNNPYGTPDYAINGNNHGEGENGGGVKMNVASGSVFKGKLKNPLTGNLFKKDFKKISFQENMFTKKLENGDAYAQNTANLILPVLAKTKEDMEMYQQAILDNKKQAKDLRAGIMPEQSQGKMPMVKHGGMMNYMAMGGIQESDYQTDPGNLPSLLRQKRANDAALLGIRSSFGPKNDTTNINDPLVVTFNKAKNYGKELADKIKNHPDNKKIEPFAMGGKLPMYQDGAVVPKPQQQPFYGNYSNWGNTPVQGGYTGYIPENKYMQIEGVPAVLSTKVNPYTQSGNMVNTELKPGYGFENEAYFDTESNQFSAVPTNNNNNAPSFFNRTSNSDVSNPVTTYTATDARKEIADRTLIPLSKNNNKPESFMKNEPEGDPTMGPMQKDKTFKKRLPQYFPEPEGFDWANAGKQVGNFALQNAGNLYDLYRSTQDNSKLNLSRMSPTLLDKTQDLANNQRIYSEGKRQTAEASQGNASTYLNNMYANRASKFANDLNINTTYGNLNASIDNAAKLYNAGAIDKETMFKLQAEGMNRNLRGQALAGMGQNFMNQGLTNDKTSMDEKTLNLFTKNMKDPTFRKDLLEFMNKKESKVKE